MAKTYKDMRVARQDSVRYIEKGRQIKAARLAHASPSAYFGGSDDVRPARLMHGEHHARMARWNTGGSR